MNMKLCSSPLSTTACLTEFLIDYVSQPDPDLPDTPPQVGECTMAEGQYISYFNNCFRLVTDAFSYSDARAFCEEDSTTLATIKDGYEEAFVETMMYTNTLDYVWIGLTDKVGFSYALDVLLFFVLFCFFFFLHFWSCLLPFFLLELFYPF